MPADRGPSAYHRLNPLTKLLLAVASAVLAVAAGGLSVPLAVLLLLVAVPAALAGVLAPLIRTALLLSLPLAASALLVNAFLLPGGSEVLLVLGPFRATREGLDFALAVLARVAAISGSVVLFSLTTRPATLVADLERRGLPPRMTFALSMSVVAVPGIVERARSVVRAQRARGLDTEGRPWDRARALPPLVAATVLGTIRDVDARALALEARGFTRPGRRTLLWTPPDSDGQRALRWVLAALCAAFLAVRLAGLVPPLG